MSKPGAIIKGTITVVFTTFLTLLILAIFICIGLGIGVFSDKSIQRSLSNSKYYYELHDDIYNKAEAMVEKGGLPSSVLQDVITLDRVYSNGQNYFRSKIGQKQPDLNMNEFNTNLSKNINDYMIEQANESDSTIKNTVNSVSKLYEDSIRWKFIDYYSSYKIGFWSIMKYLIPILLVAIGFICYILLRVYGYKKSGLWFINYALFAATCIISILTIIQLIGNNYIDSTVSPSYYRKFLIEYFRWDTLVFIMISCCSLIFSFLMIKITKYVLQYDLKE